MEEEGGELRAVDLVPVLQCIAHQGGRGHTQTTIRLTHCTPRSRSGLQVQTKPRPLDTSWKQRMAGLHGALIITGKLRQTFAKELKCT